jgi:hypothetical protein
VALARLATLANTTPCHLRKDGRDRPCLRSLGLDRGIGARPVLELELKAFPPPSGASWVLRSTRAGIAELHVAADGVAYSALGQLASGEATSPR